MVSSRKRMQRSAGFSLIELLVVIVILGVFGAFSAQSLKLAADAYLATTVREDLLRVGRIGLERMVREIRGVATSTGVDAITLSAQEFSFRSALGETVSFRFAGNTVLRNGVPLIEWVKDFSFTYLNKRGDATGSGNTLHCVEISFTLARGKESLPFRATVFPAAFNLPIHRWYEL